MESYSLSSRERILRCIRREAIDRVPISTYELSGWNENAWENKEPSYARLMDAIREYTDCIEMCDPYLDTGPDPNCETETWREGISVFTRRTYHAKDRDLTALYRVDEGVHTTWTIQHPLEDIGDIDAYLSLPDRTPRFDYGEFSRRRDRLGGRGVMMVSIGDPICQAANLFEMGTLLVHAITVPEKIRYLLDALHERQMHELRDILKNDMRDVLFRICGPEYATPPYLPPARFHDLVTAYLIPICREIREAGGIPRIHCHGKIGRVLDEFMLTCAEGLDPIEPPPDGDIGLAEVKKRCGDRFCLFGNIELRELETAEPDRIDHLVRRAMEEAKDGGGFVLMPTSAPLNVPLSARTRENYLRMFESALAHGRY